MSIGWAADMIGWACAQPFPTLATPLPSTSTIGSFSATASWILKQLPECQVPMHGIMRCRVINPQWYHTPFKYSYKQKIP